MNENYAKLYLTSLDAEDIAKATWGELHKQNGGWGRRESVLTTDSRIKEEHGIFAAITGERVDGHLFIADELRRGVRIIIAEHMPEYGEGDEDAASIPADFIIVNNTVSALLRLGRMFIEKSGVKRIAVTGSVGKTTTKEFIYSVLSQRRKTHKTSGNKNTAIGTSLTALEIECDAEYAVFECGMSGFGEISEMSRTICPHIGVITNIGTAHMEMLGSRENIAKAKLEMLDGMKPDSVLIINGDEPLLVSNERVMKHKNVISAAIYNRNADCRALNLRTENGGTTFDLIYSGRVITNIEIPVQGTHNVQDAMYAYIVGDCCGLTDDRIRAGLKNFINVSMRQMIYDIEGITVIDDAYNASPESMRAAINVLASMSRERGGRATALLGDMMELGESSALMHEKIGSYAAKSGVKVLFTYGVLAENIANAAIRNGIRAENVHVSLDTNDPQTMAEIMSSKLKPGDILLIKASRAVHAENVTERLKLLLKKTNDTE